MNNLRCPLCNENVVDSKFSQKNNMIFKCRSCLLHFVKKEYSLDENYRHRYHDGDFWNDANYDISKMISSNFSDSQGKHFLLNWTSMYEYCKEHLSKDQKILEIGVGTGVHMIMFDKIGFNVTGIEPDKHNADLINKKLINGNCINGFFEDQNFSNQFDIIWLYHVLEHVTDPSKLLLKCKDFLKNNGLIIIAVPDCENPSTLKNSIDNQDHLWHFTKNSLKLLFSKNNIELKKFDSLSQITNLNKQRIYNRLNLFHFFRKKIWPYWPLELSNDKNGYEIRAILKINKNDTLNS